MEEYGILFRADKQMYFSGFMDYGSHRWVDEAEDATYLSKTQLEKTMTVLSTIFNITTEIRGLS